MYILIYILWGF